MNSICQDMTRWAHYLSRSISRWSVGAGRHGSLVSKEFSISCQETGPIPHSHSEKKHQKGVHTLPPKIQDVSASECAHSLKGRSVGKEQYRHMQMASARAITKAFVSGIISRHEIAACTATWPQIPARGVFTHKNRGPLS